MTTPHTPPLPTSPVHTPSLHTPPVHRELAFANLVPPQLAKYFSISQLCVLNLIAREAGVAGQCVGTHDQVAARIGVCNTAVRNTLRKAKRLGFLHHGKARIGRSPQLANAISIVSEDWKRWLEQSAGAHTPAGADRQVWRTIEIEAAVIEALERQGEDWQDRIHALLRREAGLTAETLANAAAATVAVANVPVAKAALTQGAIA